MNKENISEQNNIDVVEQTIKSKILIIRGEKVILDKDLAELYNVTTKRFNEQVKRNLDRFPSDFMFRLTEDEYLNLRSQFATSSLQRGGSRYLPYAFTEHGVAMLSSVLNSEKAVQMNILIIRIFIKIKEWILSNREIEIRVSDIERIQEEQGDVLNSINIIVERLIDEPIEPKEKIGFNEKDRGEDMD